MTRRWVWLAAVVLVAACGAQTRQPSLQLPAVSGPTVEITPLAVAALAMSELPDGSKTREAAKHAAYVGYPHYAVSLTLEHRDWSCPPSATCAELDPVDGEPVQLSWVDDQEDGPGWVTVSSPRADGWVASAQVEQTGVTGDPRDLRLRLDLETLERLATNPRLDVSTDQALVDAGKALRGWDVR